MNYFFNQNKANDLNNKKVVQNLISAAVLSCLLLASFCLTATPTRQWHVQQIQIEEGLPALTVYSVTQDQSGFIWFGTTNGLARYDGYSLKTLVHDESDSRSISSNNAGNLFIDNNNNLWVGTFGGGVNTIDIDNNSITRHPFSNKNTDLLTSQNIQTFYQDKAGVIWIGTQTGLYSYADELFKYHDLSVAGNDLTHNRIWSIAAAGEHALWVATSEGLYWFDTTNETVKHYLLPEELAFDVSSNQFRTLMTHQGILWVGSASGLYSFNPQNTTFEFHHDADLSLKINDIEAEGEHKLLIGSMSGVYEFDTQAKQFKKNEFGEVWNEVPDSDIRDVFIDAAGIIWLATRDNGVYKVNAEGGMFQYHQQLSSSQDKQVTAAQIWSIIGNHKNEIIFGTSDTLYKKPNNQSTQYQRLGMLDEDGIPGIIRYLHNSSKGGMWIAVSSGLYRLPKNTTTVVPVTVPFDLVGIEPTDTFSVYESMTGDLWLSLYNVGVLHWKIAQQTAQLYRSVDNQPLSDLNLTSVYETSQGDILIASNLVGLIKYDPTNDHWQLFNHDFNDINSLSSNRVKDIYEDKQGRIWVGTARGLNLFDVEAGRFTRFDEADNLYDSNINVILEDSEGYIWLGHRFGLSQLNPSNKQVVSFAFNESIKKDGAIMHSGYITEDNVIYLGSANGYYTFDTKEIKYNTNSEPELLLTDVKINNQNITQPLLSVNNNEFELQHDDQSMAFQMAVLDYINPEQIQYSYQIQPIQQEWLDVTASRHVELRSLKPGVYEIIFKAINIGGQWDDQLLSVGLIVHPAWWDRSWVKLLFFLLLGLLAYLAHFRKTLVIRKQNLALETEVSKRTYELQRLNEKLAAAANSDFLTGLPNRMSFINSVNEKMAATGIDGHIVLADIDKFKSINDQLGHNAGDEVLRAVAKKLAQELSDVHLIARWGGEEFIFLIDGSDASNTLELVEELRKNIAQESFNFQGKKLKITLTFGVSKFTAGVSLIQAVNAADMALYQGKRAGRNIVVMADNYENNQPTD